MGTNKSRGNMYGFITETWNVIKGKCPHDCVYCYMKRYGNPKPIRFDNSEFKTDLSQCKFIFVGSSCDMWAKNIPTDWINQIMDYCYLEYPQPKYLFQTKNPHRFIEYGYGCFSKDTILATTIETNRGELLKDNAPHPFLRVQDLAQIDTHKTMVTIEPIMDFDVQVMIHFIENIKPFQVNIGANSRNDIKLVEPEKEKIDELISELKRITNVYLKPNLKRLRK